MAAYPVRRPARAVLDGRLYRPHIWQGGPFSYGVRLRRILRRVIVCVALAHTFGAAPIGAQVPSPESHFGFRIGSDRRLANADDIDAYFELVASRSDRVALVNLGATTDGHQTLAAIVSSPDNIRNLEKIRLDNQRLADPRTLPADEARRIAATHKAVVAIGNSIHASEVGGSQAASELLYALVTAKDADTLDILDRVVVVLIPSLNPDGQRRIEEWYRRTKETAFEGAAMPWLDHRYAGHDINRDAFMMNLAESRNLAHFFYTAWHPQVFLSLHQMGSYGPRMTVPPMADPIDPNYDPVIWREAALLGDAMALELQRDGRTGVATNSMYDYYWPGYEDSAPLGHNTVCLLTEVAGVGIATPITVAAGELRPPAGAAVRQINAPDPWTGGRWGLRDIIDYDLSAVRGLLHAVSAYRQRILDGFYDMGARAVEAGKHGGPFAFVIPPDQHDPRAAVKLADLLLRGAVEIRRAAAPFRADGQLFPEGSDIVLLAQPYRAYVKTLLERQQYPVRQSVARNESPERPYDVAGWTLPAQMGVDVRTIDRAFDVPETTLITAAAARPAAVSGERRPSYYLIDARGNGGAAAINRLTASGAAVSWTTSPVAAVGGAYPPGSLVVTHTKTVEAIVDSIARDLGLRAMGLNRRPNSPLVGVGTARLAVYRPWMAAEDEGWTRLVLDEHGFRYATLLDAEVQAGNLKRHYDAIVLPSMTSSDLLQGNPTSDLPAEYTGGLGTAGLSSLRAFVEAGGTLICLDRACALAIDEFGLPLSDVTRSATSDMFFCPGSILGLDVDPLLPEAYGMLPRTAAFFASSSAYDVHDSATNVQVSARYASRDLLVSGWLSGEQVIAGRPAVAEVKIGAGRVVILGFPVQHRGQSLATFRFLFNALLTAR
jgi:hypothetical protein